MKNDKSYSELAKSYAMNKRKKEACLKELLIDMIIHESNLTHKKRVLTQQIDDALDNMDKEKFMELSSEMNKLEKMLGIY
jgi:uncharacterized protein YpiB (UPF0302 family)